MQKDSLVVVVDNLGVHSEHDASGAFSFDAPTAIAQIIKVFEADSPQSDQHIHH